MKYLITGSNGFVGRYLVDLLSREADADLVCIDRHAPADTRGPAKSYSFDLLDARALMEIVRQEEPDFVVHLASVSSVGYSWREPIESFANNTNIFLNLLEAVRLHAPRARILSVGSSEQYGVVTEESLPLHETAALRPASPYAVARVAQEHLGHVYVRGYGLDIVSTRSFNHVGPGQSDRFVVSAIGKQFAEVLRGRRTCLSVGVTSVVRDFLDVRDVVQAYRALLARGETGEVYNICSGRATTIADVIAMFRDATGVEPRVETDPAMLRPVENAMVVGSHEKLTRAVDWRPSYRLEQSLRAVVDYWLTTITSS